MTAMSLALPARHSGHPFLDPGPWGDDDPSDPRDLVWDLSDALLDDLETMAEAGIEEGGQASGDRALGGRYAKSDRMVRSAASFVAEILEIDHSGQEDCMVLTRAASDIRRVLRSATPGALAAALAALLRLLDAVDASWTEIDLRTERLLERCREIVGLIADLPQTDDGTRSRPI